MHVEGKLRRPGHPAELAADEPGNRGGMYL